MKSFALGLSLFLAASISAFAQKTENRALEPFSEIEIAGGFNVELVQGTTQSLAINSEKIDTDKIESKISGKTLRIKMKDKYSSKSGKITLTLTYVDINSIELAGSSNVHLNSVLKTDKLDLEIAGSGKINGEILTSQLEVEIAGSGDIEISGKTNKTNTEIAGSGSAHLEKLQSETAKIQIAGSGSVYVNASNKIEAQIAGSGDVYYTGKCEKIESNVAGSGSVKTMDK